MYQANTGDIGDATYRNQTRDALAGNYVIDGCGASLGGSTTGIVTTVESGVVRFGNEFVPVSQQSVTHPDGDPDNDRVDAITIDRNGDAGRLVGDPAPTVPSDRRFPRVRTPTLPAVTNPDLLVVGALWVPAGSTASSGLFDDYVTPREVMGDGLNTVQLIPGRDLQHVIDLAREGQTLRGDRSQVITLPGPLTVGTKNLTIRDVHLQYADGAVQGSDDHMLTLAADGITVENVTLDGNKAGQPNGIAADGIVITTSGCSVENCRLTDIPGTGVDVRGVSGTTADTRIASVIGRNIGREVGHVVALVGAGVARTTLATVRGINNATSTLRVRNGPTGTQATDLYGEDQHSVVTLSDSGEAANDAIDGLFLDGVRANNTRWILENNTSANVAHRTVYLSRVDAQNLSHSGDVGEGFVDLSNIRDVRVAQSSITGDFAGAYNVYANGAHDVALSNLTLSNGSPSRGCVGINNTVGVRATNVRCVASPGAGIRTLNNQDNVFQPTIITNCSAEGIDGPGIEITEADPAQMKAILVKNNYSDVVLNGLSEQTPIIKDNMTPP